MKQENITLSATLLQEDRLSREQALTHDSFIVEAPAGAGKTELLTQRFLKLLQTVDSPEEIIAITFTNKAASEMKSRIMDSLQMAADGVLPAQSHKQVTFELGKSVLARSAERNWHLLDTPSRLRIYTIDSLSANLARQMPLLSRFGTQPSVRDDPRPHYEEAAIRAIEQLEDAQYGGIVHDALHYFDNDTYKLTQLLADMLAKRDQWLLYTQNAHTAEDAEAALASMVSTDIQIASDLLSAHYQQELMPIARFAASQLTENNTIHRLLDWHETLKADTRHLPQWQALSDLLLTKDGHLRKRLDKNIGLPTTAETKPYKDALLAIIDSLHQTNGAVEKIARLRCLPSPEQDGNTWQMIATLAKLLHVAVGELWLVFQAHGEVDFVEISQRSLLALQDMTGNTTDLALKLDYRIQHLLVDEFQDTSPSQIQLIQALTRGWQKEDGRTLFCVGDPMQSIYRFRKANVGLFLHVTQNGIGNIALKSLKLWRNNRSTPPVVEWINHAFEHIFPQEDSIKRGAIRYRPFVATKAGEPFAGVSVHAMLNEKINANDEENNEDGPVTDIRQLEANTIIEIIQKTRAHQSSAKIAVLVRARSHLTALVTEIRRNHPTLSFQAVEIEELVNRQIVQDLLSLSYALHQRADRVHWLAILRAPWCGLTLADLHALVANDRSSTVMELMQNEDRVQSLSEDGQQRLLHVRDVLTEALASKGRMSESRWLHGIWLMLGGAACLWDAADVRDVQAFFTWIQQLENTGQFSPQQLASEVEKLYAAPDARADDTLQLMTIHKSKGLEFDTVILPGLDRKTGGSEQPLLLWEQLTPEHTAHEIDELGLVVAPFIPKGSASKSADCVTPYDYLKMLEKERAALEDARVLYVAATRAERCLHLLGAANVNKAGEINAPKHTFLDMVWPIVHEQFNAENAIKPNAPIPNAGTQRERLANLANFKPQLIRLNEVKTPSIFVQFKSSNTFSNEKKQDNHAVLDADIGTLTHLYLELIASSEIQSWTAARINRLESAMQRWFKQKAYANNISQAAAKRVRDLLLTTIQSKQGQWVLQARTNATSELEICAIVAQSVEKKIIDRTFVDEGVRWVIDYKSIALNPDIAEADLVSTAMQYQAQLDAYAALFKHQDHPIQKAIFFVSIGRLIKLD